MKDQRKSEIKVGITAVAAFIVFILVLAWAKNFSMSSNKHILTIAFDNVSGLEKGDAVTVNGVRKGYVSDIVLRNEKSTVIATLDNDVDIRSDAKFFVSMLDLMGGKKVEILAGKSYDRIDYSKTYYGEFSGDIPSLVFTFSQLKDKLPVILDQLSVTLTSINKITSDQQLIDQIKSTVTELRTLTNNANSLIIENKSNLKEITSNTVEISKDVKTVLKDNKTNVKETFDNLQILLRNANSLTYRVDSLLTETKGKKNNLGKILYDEKTVEQLQNTLQQVNDLVKTLNNQLQNEGVNVKAKLKIF